MPSDPLTVHERLAATARRFPDKPFLAVVPETAAAYGIRAGEITYGAILAETDALAKQYRAAGYGPGIVSRCCSRTARTSSATGSR